MNVLKKDHNKDLTPRACDIIIFSMKLALRFGVDESIIIHFLHTEIRADKQNKWHHIPKKDWYVEYLPFWSHSKVDRLLTKLKKQEIIFTKVCNKNNYDRTLSYTLNYKLLIPLTWDERAIELKYLSHQICDELKALSDAETNNPQDNKMILEEIEELYKKIDVLQNHPDDYWRYA